MLDSKSIGLELKMLRIKNGLTLKQASEQLGMHSNTLCRYEKDAKKMNVLLLGEILKFYKVEPIIFFNQVCAELHK